MTVARRADKKVNELEAEIEQLMAAELAALEASKQPSDPPEEENVKPQTASEPLGKDEATFRQRYSDLRRHSQKKETELLAKITELETKFNNATTVPTDKVKVEEWARTNPQAAAIIKAIADEQAGKKANEWGTKIKEIEEVNQQHSKIMSESRVRKVHNDYDDIIVDNAFHDWAETQPMTIQNLIYDNINSEDIIWAISLYKTQKGLNKPDNSAAKAVDTKSNKTEPAGKTKGRFTESMVEKMTAEEYEKNEEAIMKEMRTNPEFYDLSGGAR